MKRYIWRWLLLFLFISITVGVISFLYFKYQSPQKEDDPTVVEEVEDEGEFINYTYEIVNNYPHNQDAFTQGLVFEDGFLYEGTGIEKHSSLRKLVLESGRILKRYNLSSKYFGEGITIFDDKIVQLTWQSNTGFVYDKASFEFLEEFSYATEGWGITHDGENLIMSDGSAYLYFLDPVTYEEVSRIEVVEEEEQVKMLNELEYINGSVYANVWQTDFIVIIDPESGEVTGKINLEGLLDPAECIEECDVLNGIAYDVEGDRLFVTGKLWPKLFEIELVHKE